MAATLTHIEKLKKKFKNLDFKVVETSPEGKADVFAITYQKNGLPGKISPGLMEVNAVWDERQSRPKGYFIAAGFEKYSGVCVSVMVSEEWLDNNKVSEKRAEWESTL
jgi:hypothetical protein